MTVPHSAGILLYRLPLGRLEVLLAHPGGPFWKNRDHGAWMIPKGGVEPGEDASACALREFEEELGTRPAGIPDFLCRIRQTGGKWVDAFALEGDLDATAIVSNHFTMEYPPRSGQLRSFPEIDAAAWYGLDEARARILPSQRPILDALEAALAGRLRP
ncbi:NUDIX domain-containing protein [Sphingosinicella sp. BN140058]|uniref:NUDIX domain-containing protein n=1 Tax=Sphingosinicella sp. BN140058 TaxID=1892855 RepID=UPI0010134E03|nr:NUDIX domain-containing protein [Sphingosinicella sp. BN140058]QAY76261.1 NUDIX domain-containing protein [Sphingosinicella sp. BN140058]